MVMKSPQHSKHPNGVRCVRVFSRALAFVLLASTLAGLSAADRPEALSFELEDQFGALYSTADFEGRPVIVIGSDRAGRQESQIWAQTVGRLLETDGELQGRAEILRIADLRSVPGFLKGKVTKQLQRSLETPLLLDWGGQVVGFYEFQPETANVVLLNRDGAVVLRIESGEPQKEEVENLKRAVLDLESSSTPLDFQWERHALLGSCL